MFSVIKKIKKIRKKLYIKIENRQRSNRALQKGDGLFISLEAFVVSYGLKQAIQVRLGRIAYILCGLLSIM